MPPGRGEAAARDEGAARSRAAGARFLFVFVVFSREVDRTTDSQQVVRRGNRSSTSGPTQEHTGRTIGSMRTFAPKCTTIWAAGARFGRATRHGMMDPVITTRCGASCGRGAGKKRQGNGTLHHACGRTRVYAYMRGCHVKCIPPNVYTNKITYNCTRSMTHHMTPTRQRQRQRQRPTRDATTYSALDEIGRGRTFSA